MNEVSPFLGWKKKIQFLLGAVLATFGLYLPPASAAEVCITSIDSVQVSNNAGVLSLYLYSKDVINLVQSGSTYLYL